MAPGAYMTLWNNEAGYAKSFATFPGYYETGDAGTIDADGFVHVMGRTDDIINVAGHRLSTGQMEQIVATHPAVAECAVIGADDALKGMIPMGFVVLKAGQAAGPDIERDVVKLVRDELGPVGAFKNVHVVGALPKTRSGKILRGTMAKIADGEAWKMPATIDDPAILDEITAALNTLGLAKA